MPTDHRNRPHPHHWSGCSEYQSCTCSFPDQTRCQCRIHGSCELDLYEREHSYHKDTSGRRPLSTQFIETSETERTHGVSYKTMTKWKPPMWFLKATMKNSSPIKDTWSHIRNHKLSGWIKNTNLVPCNIHLITQLRNIDLLNKNPQNMQYIVNKFVKSRTPSISISLMRNFALYKERQMPAIKDVSPLPGSVVPAV